MMRKSRLQWCLLSALLLLTIVLALCAGRYAVSVTAVLQILADTLTGRSPSAEYSRTAENVVLYVRLPRILIAGLAGA
ncbi:ABC transporter permease, partial [Morganella morganii]